MIFCTHHHNHSLQIYQHCVMVTSGCSFLLNPENAKRNVLCQKEPFWEPCECQKCFLRCCLLGSKGCRNDVAWVWCLHDMHRYSKSSIQRTWERCRVRENVTRKRARPRKWAWEQIGENVIGEKWIWDEKVRRWDRSWDQVCHPHTLRPGVRVCWSGAPRAGDTSLLFVPVFASTSKCICMQTNWSICAPLARTVYDNINIWGRSGDDVLVKGMPRINWVMQIVEKKTQTDRISADRVAEEIRSALIRWLSQKHRSVINFKRELQYLTRMDGITFSKLEDLARLANNVY